MSENTRHWADRKERGSFWLMKLTAVAAKILGRRLLSPLLYAIVLYFFLFGRTARHSAWPTGAVRCAPSPVVCCAGKLTGVVAELGHGRDELQADYERHEGGAPYSG